MTDHPLDGAAPIITRDTAVQQIADALDGRRDYITIGIPTTRLPEILPRIPAWRCYLDAGSDHVAVFDGTTGDMDRDDTIAIGVAVHMLAMVVPMTPVITVPKTVPVATMRDVFGDVFGDSNRDLVLVKAPDGQLMWPMLFVDALEIHDPQAAADLHATAREHRQRPTNPATVALIDQADAASGHALDVLHATADLAGGRVEYDYSGPVTRVILDRLCNRLIRDDITLCPHLSYTAPAFTAWLAYAPGRLRCVTCTAAAAQRIKGTRDDMRCDHCGKVSTTTIHPTAVQLPPIVVELPTGPGVCLPPIAVHFGLCPACRERDR